MAPLWGCYPRSIVTFQLSAFVGGGMKACTSAAKFNWQTQQRTKAWLDAIEEEDGYDDHDTRGADRSAVLTYLRRVHPAFVLHRSGTVVDPKHRAMRVVVDGVKQGFSIVLYEICRGVLVVLVLMSFATVAVCVGVYVHLSQWQLVAS
ncbi:hypothetical protein H310_08739 [Aphanomyces invadans]|uniref:Uncharacterized protein n=1 Tax=Aphanomyces invadans TaxID=157072 RepID=A0A024TZ36_9STRA|nr:hypothetical protein H310_08739 [Aphanomyces invadans]ETV98622.1 hypothetical protein H310_08739 [Aphanomyces invadans]|eukprot:XP_008872819.1 hypothetical protein H310_08739 [Aphanomyces invadans]